MSHVLFALFTCLVLCNAYIRQIYCDIVRLSLFFNENITLLLLGAAHSPSNLSITASKPPAVLTWLPPPNGPTYCAFNYTINITTTSSSSSTAV